MVPRPYDRFTAVQDSSHCTDDRSTREPDSSTGWRGSPVRTKFRTHSGKTWSSPDGGRRKLVPEGSMVWMGWLALV